MPRGGTPGQSSMNEEVLLDQWARFLCEFPDVTSGSSVRADVSSGWSWASHDLLHLIGTIRHARFPRCASISGSSRS